MPEGDTVHRSAATLQRWLGGRRLTAASGRRIGFDPGLLVGTEVGPVEARGKHLLIHLDEQLVVHTHLRMTGSWHVYPSGERWRKPAAQARLVLAAGLRVAVCFNAPVVELRRRSEIARDPVLAGLGPDLLGAGPLEPAELVRRARQGSARSGSVAELLLDQRVVAGIGNIYRCETLFLCGVDPHTRAAEVDPATLQAIIATASRLLRANAAASAVARRFDAPAEQTWVYRRAGRPCRRCGAPVRSEVHGANARILYWCPSCQKPGPACAGPRAP